MTSKAVYLTLTAVLCLATRGWAFDAFSYVNIDFGHYFRLAQCQAKCTEKYGEVATRTLLDGTQRRQFMISNRQYEWCQRGCSHGRILTKKATRSAPIETAYKDGQGFWLTSAADNGTNGKSPIEAVDVLCIQPAIADDATGFTDSLTAKFAARIKADFVAPVRFIVQWKQALLVKGGKREETPWITASIEHSPLVSAEQLQPGVLYRFMMTLVGPAGRMGKSVESDWLQAPSVVNTPPQPDNPVQVRSQFNSDDSVSALILWPTISVPKSSVVMPRPDFLLVAPLTSCHFHLRVENSSGAVNQVVDRDQGDGILMRDLAFSSDYRIRMRSFVPGDAATLIDEDSAWPIDLTYRSMSCIEVHGRGSLECDPEAVSNVTVDVHVNNASIAVSWVPTADVNNVLLYQLVFYPLAVADGGDVSTACAMGQTSLYRTAASTTASAFLPTTSDCEYELKVVTYDLFGREAIASARFHFTPPPLVPLLGLDDLSNLWIVVVPATVLLLLCLVINCVKCCDHRRCKKVSAVTKAGMPVPEAV